VAKRQTISDLAQAAGVSVATVDRVLNQRHPVRASTVQRVLRAAESTGFHATELIKHRLQVDVPARTFGYLLQRPDTFYRQLGADLASATTARKDMKGKAIVEYIDELSPTMIVQRMTEIGSKVDALAIVSIDHPHVSLAIERLRERGIPTFAIISDLTAEARTGYLGHDSRKEGRTAAWIISRTVQQPGKIAIIVGSHRIVCQETAEMSFRAYFRENAPQFHLLEPLINLEDPRLAYQATLDLRGRNPDLVGLYICGGGMEGVIDAAREDRSMDSVAIVCNELTDQSRAGLIDGILTAVISTRTKELAAKTVEAMLHTLASPGEHRFDKILIPFDLHISENI
jgi:LacI family transcriptional regulator